MLLSIVIGVLIVLVVFGGVVCIIEREWGTLAFAAVMIAAMVALAIYGTGHTPVG